jgi:hypothetical protein
MQCSDIRAALPGLVYGDLKPAETQAVTDHVVGCPACRAELAELQQLSGLLHKLQVPRVQVDVPGIFRESQLRQERQVRRWRRAAVALTGVAAAVVAVMLLKLEIRVDGRQLVVRWGDAPQAVVPTVVEVAPAPRKSPPEGPAASAKPEVTRTDLRLLRELIHALAADVNGRDRQQQETLAQLQGQVDRLEREAQERWAATVRYVAAGSRPENQEMEGVNP